MLQSSFTLRSTLLGLALAAALPALQASEAQCILAGRLNSEGRWAPQTSGMQLLDADGRLVSHTAISSVKSVRLAKPALLSACNAGQPIADGGASQGSKSPAPAISAGQASISVLAMSALPGRADSQWIELRVQVPAERVVMLMR